MTEIVIPKPDICTIEIPLRGVTPLICHRWSEKAKKEMRDKQTKKASAGKQAKDPQQDFEESLYHHPEGGYGFPSVAFKSAAVRAAKQVGMAMTDARVAFHVMGELVKIEGEPTMREDMVRLNGQTADIRYRGEFRDWSAKPMISFNANMISAEQIANLFQIAGFSVGVGEWRPERNGQFGRFEIVE